MVRFTRIVLCSFLLLLPLATAALWIGHSRLPDQFTNNPAGPNYRLLFLPDCVMLTRDTFHPPLPVTSVPIPNPDIHIAVLGVGYHYVFRDFGEPITASRSIPAATTRAISRCRIGSSSSSRQSPPPSCSFVAAPTRELVSAAFAATISVPTSPANYARSAARKSPKERAYDVHTIESSDCETRNRARPTSRADRLSPHNQEEMVERDRGGVR